MKKFVLNVHFHLEEFKRKNIPFSSSNEHIVSLNALTKPAHGTMYVEVVVK